MRKLITAALALMLLCVCAAAETEFKTENGYTLSVPEGWSMSAPSEIAIGDSTEEERAVQTLYASEEGGYRIDIYEGESEALTGVDARSFHGRLDLMEELKAYFSESTENYWILDGASTDAGAFYITAFEYEPGNEYLMAFMFRGSTYTGFVFYNLDGETGLSLEITDEDYKLFDGIMKSVKEI